MSWPFSFSGGLRVLRRTLCVLAVLSLAACNYLPPNINVAETTAVGIGPGAGFGDRQNSFAWSMAWFNNKLYVGTVRNEMCVEGATSDFYFPGKNYYNANPGIGVTCPANMYDLNLQAEIWQYDPSVANSTARWTRVYVSPADIPNPRAPGKFVAEDIGFRSMVVYTDPNDPTHQPALYVAGVTADEYIPELRTSHPPRILRTTDGTSFTPVAGAPGVLSYDVGDGKGAQPSYAMGYRAMAVYNNRLFVTATPDLTGDGPVVEISNPSGSNPTFAQVSPPSLDAYEMEVFNGQLYVGAGSYQTGYSVWRTDASGSAPYSFTPVVVGGAGRGKSVTSVVSMRTFKGRLYVGASGWLNSLLPISEMIRINPDDSVELVSGNPRQVWLRDGTAPILYPISGFPDGFGNPFSGHFWRMQDYNNGLLMGTNDWSSSLQLVPILNTLTQSQWGFDIQGTCDGRSWYLTTQDAFGDGQYNFGARTMAASPDGQSAFIGSANDAQGTQVWQLTNTTPANPLCPAGLTAQAPHASVAQPGNQPSVASQASSTVPTGLTADAQSCATILSWAPARGASQYRILRSEYQLEDVSVVKPPQLPRGGISDVPVPRGRGDVTVNGKVPVPGRPVEIATTSQPYFVDRSAKHGVYYAYVVQAVDAQGKPTSPATFAFSPSQSPATSFSSVLSAISTQTTRGKIRDQGGRVLGLVSTAQSDAARGDVAGAVQSLNAALDDLQNPDQTMDAHSAEDLAMKVSTLAREVGLASVSCDRGVGLGVRGGHS